VFDPQKRHLLLLGLCSIFFQHGGKDTVHDSHTSRYVDCCSVLVSRAAASFQFFADFQFFFVLEACDG